jgi:putative oxidoreductase
LHADNFTDTTIYDMNNPLSIAQLLLRLAIGIGFLLPVFDRFGLFGKPGEPNVVWGDWTNFVAYTNVLIPYVSPTIAYFLGSIATALELVFGLMLIVGYKTKYAAYGSFALTLSFASSMMYSLHIRAPFNFSVFVVSFSSLTLANFSTFPYSIDNYFSARSIRNFL